MSLVSFSIDFIIAWVEGSFLCPGKKTDGCICITHEPKCHIHISSLLLFPLYLKCLWWIIYLGQSLI